MTRRPPLLPHLLAGVLHDAVTGGQAQRLVLSASSDFLGELRGCLSPAAVVRDGVHLQPSVAVGPQGDGP